MSYLLFAYWVRTCSFSGRVLVHQQVFDTECACSQCINMLPNQCVHQPLFQHHWASPLSQHKGRRETSWEERGEKSGAAAKAAGCVSFPPRLKSDRVKDTELWRYLQTVGRRQPDRMKEEEEKRHSLWHFFSPLCPHSLLLKNPQPPISL